MKRALSLFAAFALLISGIAACGNAASPDAGITPTSEITQPPEEVTSSPAIAKTGSEYRAANYAEIYSIIIANLSDASEGYAINYSSMAVDDMVAEAEESTEDNDYSTTNVQVDGIDEGDVVKTDGEYIYILRKGDLIIFAADGADTREVGRITVGVEYDNCKDDGIEFHYKTPTELYILGDRIAVISDDNSGSDFSDGDYNSFNSYSQRVTVDIIDISDRSAPKIAQSFGQDGNSVSSRLNGSKLFLVSSYYIGIYATDENLPETYIPALYENDESALMPCDCIVIPPEHNGYDYSVICVYDLDTMQRSFSDSVLGGGDMIYMTANSLYIAGTRYVDEEQEPYTEDIYTVTKRSGESRTTLTRYDISGDVPCIAAFGELSGYLCDQFSMDEYGGYLRVVETNDSYGYTIYYDEEHDFSNYVWDDTPSYNSLYILDSELNTVGSITDLAEDETVRSARFDGDIGYFVTFRTTDPLFAVDLSDPTAPKVLSALKIPGFSRYLHVWDDGRLFGFGYSADEQTGISGNLKLTMFDTTDSADVTEKTTLELTGTYSEASFNHKAVLIAPEKNLIGLPIELRYEFYSYSDGDGFRLLAEVDCGDRFTGSRALYIGDTAYIVGSGSITVLDLNSFSLLGVLDFQA
jgi:uncharacterized secreted protein with C-terminal beta-propeller domain